MTFTILILFLLIFGIVYYYIDNQYTIYEIPNFLTPDECKSIISSSQNNLQTSYIYNGDGDDKIDPKDRLSQQCWLNDNDIIANKISNLVADLTNTPKNHQEPLQVVKYDKNGHFQPHYDACNGDSDFCKRMDSFIGPRYLTFLIYLNDDYTGGETVFPELNKTVKPETGKAVLFYNVDKTGQILKDSLHGGLKIENGSKWIANKWVRIKI